MSLCPMTVLPRRGDVHTAPREDITPGSSLLRTHSPIPDGSSTFSLCLVRKVFAGRYQPLVPVGFYRSEDLKRLDVMKITQA